MHNRILSKVPAVLIKVGIHGSSTVHSSFTATKVCGCSMYCYGIRAKRKYHLHWDRQGLLSLSVKIAKKTYLDFIQSLSRSNLIQTSSRSKSYLEFNHKPCNRFSRLYLEFVYGVFDGAHLKFLDQVQMKSRSRYENQSNSR